MSDNQHWEEVDRLWRAVKRDLIFDVEVYAGLHPLGEEQQKRSRRLASNWKRLCEVDMDVAAHLAHGLSEVGMMLSQTEIGVAGVTPMEWTNQAMQADLDMADIGQKANPGVKAECLGDLIELGKEAIRRAIDDELL